MRKLDKSQQQQRNMLTARAKSAYSDLEKAISDANAAIALANEKLETYNEVAEDAKTFRDEIKDEMDSYYDDRTEKWQDSDAGDFYRNWKDAWEAQDFDKLDAFEELETPEATNSSGLDNLPSEVES